MKKKQLFAVLLAGSMTVGMAPAAAFAAEDTAPAKSENSAGEEEVVALALEQPKPDYLPQGVTHSKDNKHTYHTQVNVTANVSVKDSNGAVVETKQVTESSEFLKGGVGTRSEERR